MDDFVGMVLHQHPHQRPHIDQILAHIETVRRKATEVWTEGGGAFSGGGGGDFANFDSAFQVAPPGGGGARGGGRAAAEVEITTLP